MTDKLVDISASGDRLPLVHCQGPRISGYWVAVWACKVIESRPMLWKMILYHHNLCVVMEDDIERICPIMPYASIHEFRWTSTAGQIR
uniref:Uncharacterized protein n=1 Tax=Lactuca sativa TaxID=4236 RepID=A0A9R1WQ66_LACSA|nr:hypothetical protein LSAT_V11C100008500 [Lactuca sativa]